jgi:uncharacterized protein YciI
MLHFVVELIYKKPVEEFTEIIPLHRAYLQTGYAKGMLLLSGPQEPRVGGLLIAKAESLDELKAFCAQDPYYLNGVADYRFIQFKPMSWQPNLAEWFE